MINSNCLMDHSLYQKIENKITFKIKSGYCLKLLTPDKLLGSTENKLTKEKNWLKSASFRDC